MLSGRIAKAVPALRPKKGGQGQISSPGRDGINPTQRCCTPVSDAKGEKNPSIEEVTTYKHVVVAAAAAVAEQTSDRDVLG